jgi:hypothetical protein
MTPFIQDNEYILLMEDQYGGKFTLDDLKRLRDIGVRSVVRYPYWGTIESSMGHYEWGAIEDAIALTREAGMKCLWAVYDKPPKYFNSEWYIKTPEGATFIGPFRERCLSPWNSEGWAYHLNFIKMFCDKVSADDSMGIRATMFGAESMFPHRYPYRQDGPYLETMLKMLLEEQEIFYNAYSSHELWTCFHHAFDYQKTAGTEHAEMLYQSMSDRFPDHKHYCISYTQFRHDVKGEDKNLADMKRLGLSMFGGSEHAGGLLDNTDRAIAEGFRGFICGPIHFMTPFRQMEEWMFNAFEESLGKWRAAREVH